MIRVLDGPPREGPGRPPALPRRGRPRPPRQRLWAIAAAALISAAPAWAKNYNYPVDWRKAECGGGPATSDLCRPLDLADYKLSWADEFDTLKLTNADGRGPWIAGVHSPLAPNEIMSLAGDPAYSVSDGKLVLSTRSLPNGKRSEANMQGWGPGGKHWPMLQNFYAEVRLRGPLENGSHFGLWWLSVERGKGHMELDWPEQYGPEDRHDHGAAHIWPVDRKAHPPAHVSVFLPRPEGSAMAWHIYGLRADDLTFTLYRDGKPLAQIDRLPDQRVPLYPLISLFGHSAKVKDTDIQVDYIRVYAPKSDRSAPK